MYTFLSLYFHMRLHNPSASGSLVLVIKLRAEENVDSAVMLLFHLNKSRLLFKDLLLCTISRRQVMVTSVISTSEFNAFLM